MATAPPDDDQARADADHAWRLALNLYLDGEPPAAQLDAYVSLLLAHCNAEAARVAAAVTECQQRQRDSPDDEIGFQSAEVLLRRAMDRLAAAGADGGGPASDQFRRDLHGSLFPDPQPFEWPRHRRRSLRWWLRRIGVVRARLIHVPAATPTGVAKLVLVIGALPVGTMLYQVCHECRRGMIGKLSINAGYQGLGLGRRAVRHVFRRSANYSWRTSTQYATSGTFWTAMASRTGGAFTDGDDAACTHMSPRPHRGAGPEPP